MLCKLAAVLVFCLAAATVAQEIVATHNPAEGSSERVTPDYIAGPWTKMDPEQGFQAVTERPKVTEAIALLANATATIDQINAMLAEDRAARDAAEQAMITQSQSTIRELTEEMARIAEVTAAFNKIRPSQARIKFETDEILTPLLREISGLFTTDAQVRFPFAERLAVFTEDLQKTLRAREDAECKLRPYLPADELQGTLAKYDEIAEKIKAKIDSEVKAAGDILNPNSKRLRDVTSHLEAAEKSIQSQQDELKEALVHGASFIPHEDTVKGAILDNQQALLNSVQKAVEIENTLLAELQEFHEREESVVYHMQALLNALLQPNDQPAQSAFEKPVAVQTVRRAEQ